MPDKKTAVITGGSSGIGLAIAKALAKNNYQVVNADIREGEKVASIDNIRCDVTLADDITRLYKHVKINYGIPDVLVSNAGQGIHEKLSEGDPEKWKRIIDINLVGALRFIRAFIPEMLARKSGSIFFISSIAAAHPYEYGGIYAASKAALNMVGKTLQHEAAGAVRTFVISPGVVDSSFFEHMIGSNHTADDIGLGSISVSQMAELILYLLSLPPSIHVPEVTLTPVNQVL